MSLATYRKKRVFSTTPEPTGGKVDSERLHFVVQKHDATRLHYDFRLEMQGVLKSWAVPKGPSTDPEVKRLAMMVEDHPYDYKNFEGIIPKGQYGGGTVIVWDEGYYIPADKISGNKKVVEKNLVKELKAGKISFTLFGKKLKGNFSLVKSHYQGENSWLLIKMKDKFSKKSDVTKKGKSVISGKTIEQMEKTPDKVYGGTNNFEKKRKSTGAKPEKKKGLKIKGKKRKFPSHIQPMLATLVDKPFDEDGWLYEIKWDGYRTIAYMHNGKTELKSRNNKSFNEKFYPVYNALAKLSLNAVIDGEVIVADKEGVSNFGNLQNWRSEADGNLIYYVFDLLWQDGYSFTGLPLIERRKRLVELLPENDTIKISQTFESTATEFFAAVEKLKLEGIIAKKYDSHYTDGIRSKEWLKIKTSLRHEVVIGGYTQNEGSSKSFSALLVGVHREGKFIYTGKIGTGFSDHLQKELLNKFRLLTRNTSPFSGEPDVNKPSRFRPSPPHAKVTWLKPRIVCEVSYTEVTSDGVMRHPSFEGLRVDKKANDVKEEKLVTASSVTKKAKSVLHKKNLLHKTTGPDRKTLLNPTDIQQERKINGHTIKFTNLNKLYWPKEKISKRDMLNYYFQVAPYMLPYLKDRPQSLNRHPNGINGMSFYQKDVTGKVPDWIETFPYKTEGVKKNFMVCTREEDILYMASLGCIELNPWSSRIETPDNPDWCIIDLDPDKNKFEQVIETARVTRDVLESVGLTGYCKTSGSTGLHIYIPLGAKYSYETSKEFGRLIATLVHQQLPSFTSIERATANRKGRIYIDFLQNRLQATLAAPYSLRPKPGATVSMPLAWDEVKKGLTMQDFTIHNAVPRIRELHSLFKPVLGKGIDIKKAILKLENLNHIGHSKHKIST